MMWQVETNSGAATLRLAEAVGGRLRGGEVIELVSDLGGGKTTFTRGLARGAGSQDKVTSPTFTLSNEYKAKNFTIYHFDFYRLHDPGIMADELAEILEEPDSVAIVEWADVAKGVLPKTRLTIKFTATGERSRQVEFTYPKEMAYLIPKEK